MNKALLLFSVLFLCTGIHIAFAQKDIPAYYRHTNQAEISLVQGNKINAAKEYKAAFTANDAPFYTDLCNAMVLAAELNAVDDVYAYAELLAAKGIGERFFAQHSKLLSLRTEQSARWKALLRNAATSREKWDAQNKELNARIKALFDRDQEVHTTLQTARANYKETETEVKRVDDSISAELNKIFDQYGFLSEFNMGIFLGEGNWPRAEPDFYVIIRHNFQGITSYDTLFAPLCKKAIAQGTLHPMTYATFRDANPSNGNLLYGTSHVFTRYKCTLYTDLKTKKEDPYAFNPKEQVDSMRSTLHLSTLEDVQQKILYRMKNQSQPYIFRDNYSIIGSFANMESEQRFLERNKVIMSQVPGCTF